MVERGEVCVLAAPDELDALRVEMTEKAGESKPRAVQVGTGNKSVAALGKEDLLELKLADNFLERYGVNY